MRTDDCIRLQHMLDAAEEALRFATGRTRSDLETDRMLMLSLVKDIEIIGEAASRISVEFKAANPEIPWQDIIDMRNRLIHMYFDVNCDIVWATVVTDLPFLADRLRRMLPSRG